MLTYFKMADKSKGLTREIEIPEGIEIEVKENEAIAKKEGKENRKIFFKTKIEKSDNKIILKTERSTKREIKQINTNVSHIKNMLQGLQEKFVYKLQICSVHFPMNVSIKDNELVIKNFLGETKERKTKISPKVDVKIEGEMITIESHDKEAAGQIAANIEKTTVIRGKDKRIYQDGIYMVEKAGREIWLEKNS